MEWNELEGLFGPDDEAPGWMARLQQHAALIGSRDGHPRVTSVAPEDIVRRHYAESLEIWRIAREYLGVTPQRAVDVGSGGGFPGLVMACVSPGTSFTLVEPLQKRARLLEAAAAELALSNLSVVAERAEDAGRGALRGSADLVTARAVAGLSELLEYTAPFARAGGVIALPKGSGWEGELGGSGRAQDALSCRFVARVPMRAEISETVSVLLFEQEKTVGDGFPRRAGVPHKRPI